MPIRYFLCLVALIIGLGGLWGEAQGAQKEQEARDTRETMEAKPLWEWGIGGGGAYVPDYPASDNYQLRGLGVPYFIYRGDILRVGDGGVRAMAVDDPTFELDVSLSGALNADSEDNEARRGMPDLDFLVGLGPQLRINLNDKTARTTWDLRFQSRAVFLLISIESSIRALSSSRA